MSMVGHGGGKLSSALASSSALRAAVAFIIAGGSFAAPGYLFEGECIFPYGLPWTIVVLLFFPTLFLVGFVWFVSELTCPVASFVGPQAIPARFLSVLVALGVYAVVAWTLWLSSPTPVDASDSTGYRLMASAFWSVGILVKMGNFSDYSCGY